MYKQLLIGAIVAYLLPRNYPSVHENVERNLTKNEMEWAVCKYSINKKIKGTKGHNDQNSGINEPRNGTTGFILLPVAN